MNAQFAPYAHKDVNLTLPKLAYCALQFALFCVAVYKFSIMGVIPVQPSDWIGVFSTRVAKESHSVFVN